MVAVARPPASDGGGAQALEYVQTTPAATWTIQHNRGAYPAAVEVIDTAGSVILGGVSHPTPNLTILTFSAPFSGRAIII